MSPTSEWIAQWQLCRANTRAPLNLNEYFSAPAIAGMHLSVLDIGPCSLPSGQLLVRDPLCSLENPNALPYFQPLPPGAYRTELCVILPERKGDCARYAAARLRFSDRPAVVFEEALTGSEHLDELADRRFFGVQIDTGLACLCDEITHVAFCSFVAAWRQAHPGGNLYDDYFAPFFTASHYKRPEHQRRGGDWINWQVPNTEYFIPLFESGFGDGHYPVYFGYDDAGEICQLVVHMIDIRTAFDRPSRYLSPTQLVPVSGGLRGQVTLEKWDSYFETPGPYSLFFPGATQRGFSTGQLSGYDFLLLNQDELYSTILSTLLDLFPTVPGDMDLPVFQRPLHTTGAAAVAELATHLTPLEIVIHPIESGGLPYIGYRFACSWNKSNGFGILLYGSRVVGTGEGSVAMSIQSAKQDLVVARASPRKQELMKILRAKEWEERHGNVYMTACYRSHDLLFYFTTFDEARLRLFEQDKLKRLMAQLEDLNRQAHEILLRTRPNQVERDFPISQISIATDGSFRLGFEELDGSDAGDLLLWVDFTWDFRPTGVVVYDTY